MLSYFNMKTHSIISYEYNYNMEIGNHQMEIGNQQSSSYGFCFWESSGKTSVSFLLNVLVFQTFSNLNRFHSMFLHQNEKLSFLGNSGLYYGIGPAPYGSCIRIHDTSSVSNLLALAIKFT